MDSDTTVFTLKHVLIFLVSLAVILGIFAYFSVFDTSPGIYTVAGLGGTNMGSDTSSVLFIASSSPTSTTQAVATATVGTFGTSFSVPPVTWFEGQSTIAITGVSLDGNQMTFTMSVTMGDAPQCVPLNLSMVADEEGDLQPPDPASFSFPDSGNCNGAANATYTNQTTTFTVDPTAFPLLFTTDASSGTFFEVATTSDNGLQIQLPGTSG